ncbi:MAG: hypothetical protein HY360_12260 [Verrucomicrobia bacterium]|nr:hypothetical protein [Verrucomicrobiota bacterium]
MAIHQCPGQNRMFWKSEDIFDAVCPHCGAGLEFWKDDIRRECSSCGKTVVNPRLNLACAQWCRYADQCLEGLTLEDQLIATIKEVFADDERLFNRALQALEHAKRILESEKADARVVVAAALLFNVGIPAAGRKFGDASPEQQHAEGSPIAGEILRRLGVEEETIGRVCEIVGHHHFPRTEEPREFDVVYDGGVLQNWIESGLPNWNPDLERRINESFRTAGGRRLAKSVLLRNMSTP